MFKLEEAKPELFEFEYKGKTYGVPAIDSLPFCTFMRIRKKLSGTSIEDAGELGFDEIMSLFEQYVPEVMEEINMKQAKELFMAYATSGSASLEKS